MRRSDLFETSARFSSAVARSPAAAELHFTIRLPLDKQSVDEGSADQAARIDAGFSNGAMV